jgi:phosphoglycolate phosphatase
MVLRGILFDMDGTLIEFKIDYIRAREGVIKILEEAGYPANQLSNAMLILEMVGKAKEYFPPATFGKVKGQIDQHVEQVEHDAAILAKEVPGISKVLEYCGENNLKRGIITFNSTQNAKESLEFAGLYQYFPENWIVGRDQTPNPKPHKDHVQILLDRMELQAHEVCIIGDHPKDIEAAVNSGAHSIAIIRPPHYPNEFKTHLFCNQFEIEEKLVDLIKQIQEAEKERK